MTAANSAFWEAVAVVGIVVVVLVVSTIHVNDWYPKWPNPDSTLPLPVSDQDELVPTSDNPPVSEKAAKARRKRRTEAEASAVPIPSAKFDVPPRPATPDDSDTTYEPSYSYSSNIPGIGGNTTGSDTGGETDEESATSASAGSAGNTPLVKNHPSLISGIDEMDEEDLFLSMDGVVEGIDGDPILVKMPNILSGEDARIEYDSEDGIGSPSRPSGPHFPLPVDFRDRSNDISSIRGAGVKSATSNPTGAESSDNLKPKGGKKVGFSGIDSLASAAPGGDMFGSSTPNKNKDIMVNIMRLPDPTSEQKDIESNAFVKSLLDRTAFPEHAKSRVPLAIDVPAIPLSPEHATPKLLLSPVVSQITFFSN